MKSFKDPAYDAIDTAAAAAAGIPAALLSAIRLKGERSNADQVSSAGAKSVYQITPSTRDAALQKFGIDAYLGPKQAAAVAARLLKDSLDRNGNDPAAAVGEYHGGTDRRNWGPITKAYIKRVVPSASPDAVQRGSMPDGSQSTFDRVSGASQQSGPSVADLYGAYRSGKMPADGRKQFEADVSSGSIMLPRGAALDAVPSRPAPVVPDNIVAAYNSGSMPEEGMRKLEQDVTGGTFALPSGAKLTGPPEGTVGRGLGLGARAALQGINQTTDIPQILSAPVDALLDAVGFPGAGTRKTATEAGNNLMDVAGAPVPVTDSEKLASAAVSGAAGALPFMALGGPLAEAPIKQLIAGVTGGGASELSRQSGAGTGGQVIAGLAGALGGFGAASVAERAAGAVAGTKTAQAVARLTQGVAENVTDAAERVAAKFPRAAIVDDAGHLTADGQEIALRTGADPDRVAAAYRRRRGGERSAAGKSATGEQAPERVVRRYQGVDHPVTVLEENVADANGVAHAKVRGSDGTEGYVPQADIVRLAPEASQTAGSVPPPQPEFSEALKAEPPPPNSASAGPSGADVLPRYAEAQSEGIQLTRGQSERRFGPMNDENNLKVADGDVGDEARGFFERQQAQIKDAVERFQRGFGEPGIEPEARGEAVRAAISDLRDSGAEGVTALYREAEALGGSGVALKTEAVKKAAIDAIIDEGANESVKRAVSQELARYGLVGKAAPTNELGLTKIALDDGTSVSIRGPVKQLTLANADDLRKSMNRLFRDDTTNVTGPIKGAIDDAVEDAMELAAAGPFRSKETLYHGGPANVDTFRTGPGASGTGVYLGSPETASIYAKRQTMHDANAPQVVYPVNIRGEIKDFGRDNPFSMPEYKDLAGTKNAEEALNRRLAAEGYTGHRRDFGDTGGPETLIFDPRNIKHKFDPVTDGGGAEVDVGAAYQKARAAHREQVKTFRAKDIVSEIIAEKPGTTTPSLADAKVIDRIFGSDPDALANLRKTKTMLLSARTPKGKQAWAGIKAQGIADIFGKAHDAQGGTISGAKLNTAIKAFGIPKLKVLLDPAELNQLMKLSRIIGDATIPLSGTTNPSGTFTKLANFMAKTAVQSAPVSGGVLGGLPGAAAGYAISLATKARAILANKKVLDGITSFDGRETTARDLDQQAREFIEQFLDAGRAGRLVPPTLAAADYHPARKQPADEARAAH